MLTADLEFAHRPNLRLPPDINLSIQVGPAKSNWKQHICPLVLLVWRTTLPRAQAFAGQETSINQPPFMSPRPVAVGVDQVEIVKPGEIRLRVQDRRRITMSTLTLPLLL